MARLQQQSQQQLEMQQDKFNEERKDLLDKIDKCGGDMSSKDRQINKLENQNQNLNA